jgi:hypothetical protein
MAKKKDKKAKVEDDAQVNPDDVMLPCTVVQGSLMMSGIAGAQHNGEDMVEDDRVVLEKGDTAVLPAGFIKRNSTFLQAVQPSVQDIADREADIARRESELREREQKLADWEAEQADAAEAAAKKRK